MRISDWSSDVCSSDLPKSSCTASIRNIKKTTTPAADEMSPVPDSRSGRPDTSLADLGHLVAGVGLGVLPHRLEPDPHQRARSAEHTSELQSLMRISYAVFRLKTKTSNKNSNLNH